jgi:hypothetical protein
MPAFPVPFEGFEPICGRYTQIVQRPGSIESRELATSDREYLNREAFRALTVEYCLRDLA